VDVVRRWRFDELVRAGYDDEDAVELAFHLGRPTFGDESRSPGMPEQHSRPDRAVSTAGR
jgi:hypothetical protein